MFLRILAGCRSDKAKLMRVDRQGGFHENLQEESYEDPPNRAFGFTFVPFFALAGLIPLIHHKSVRPWALGLRGGCDGNYCRSHRS